MATNPFGERRRRILILGGCATVVAILLAAAVAPSLSDEKPEVDLADLTIEEIGASANSAACGEVITTPTDLTQDHVPNGAEIAYDDAPPSFGRHYDVPGAFDRPFYTPDDRPDVGNLVHDMEHGFTIAWYDETAAEDEEELNRLEAIAQKYHDDLERFAAVPWTAEDGADFPDGKHIALTRWSADAGAPTDKTLQRGNWQYCGAVSGEAISEFFETWPNEESPEPGIPMS